MWSFYFFIFVIITNLLLPSSAEELRLEEFKPRRSQTVGKKFSLFCAVQEGTGPLFYKWTKDGHPLSPIGANHQVTSTKDNSVLIINQLSPSDAGNYSCSVSNSAGQSDHQTTMLIVKGFYFPFFFTLLSFLVKVWRICVCSFEFCQFCKSFVVFLSCTHLVVFFLRRSILLVPTYLLANMYSLLITGAPILLIAAFLQFSSISYGAQGTSKRKCFS